MIGMLSTTCPSPWDPPLPAGLVAADLDRLNRERAELLEEIRQLRAAVSIYRRIAEQVTANQLAERNKDAA